MNLPTFQNDQRLRDDAEVTDFAGNVAMKRLLMRFLLVGALAIAAGTPAAAQSRGYDGLWSVLIVTENGTCDRGYRYAVRIKGGRVAHADPANSGFLIQGRVAGGGQIKVSVIRGDKRADGTGRLNKSAGGGKWRSAKGECSGIWSAERRGI